MPLKYSGWELNPHSHCCEQDFKSCVSTSSTTRVTLLYKYFNFSKKYTLSAANPNILSGRFYQFHLR